MLKIKKRGRAYFKNLGIPKQLLQTV